MCFCTFHENAFVPLPLDFSRQQVWCEQGLLNIKLKNVIDTAMEYTNFVAIEVKL